MTEADREQRISEVFDAMEADEATQEDLWDAIFPNLEWCEHVLRQLGFHCDHDTLLEIIEDANDPNVWYTTIPEAALAYRRITPETDILEHDEMATVITALRYRKQYLDSLYYPEDGTLDLYEIGITEDE